MEGLLIPVGLIYELKGSFLTSKTQIPHREVHPKAALDFISLM